MRLSPDQLIAPEAFPPQSPPAAPEAVAYALKAAAASREEAQKGTRPFRVAYGADAAQRLDVYAPENGDAKRPVLLFFHGGAWIAGFPWWSGFMSRAVEASGAMLVAGTYRLAPAQRFPAQLDDVNAAIDWLGENIGRHGALTGNRSGIVACFPVSAPLDVRYRDCAPGSPEERVYRFLLAKREDDEQASPIVHAARAEVPFHLLYGERDFPRIAEANRRFAEVMHKAGKPVGAQLMAGATHFDTHLGLREPTAPWYQALRKVVAGPSRTGTSAS